MRRLVLACLLAPSLALAQAPAPSPGPMSPADTWLPRTAAELILLDKLRAQPSTLTIRAGQSATFGTLTVTVQKCVARPPDLPQNAAAFLDVVDSRGTAPVFHGWIVSNTPAVGQLEHPVYDLRLVTCH